MAEWRSTKAGRVLAALLRIGWSIARADLLLPSHRSWTNR